MNTNVTLDVLDTIDTDELEFATDMDIFATDSDSDWEMPDPSEAEVIEVAEVKAPKAKKAPAKKAKKSTKMVAEVVEAPIEVEAEVTNEKPARSGLFVGQNFFDRIKAEGKSSAPVLWAALLVHGTVTVSYKSELAYMGKSELAERLLAESKLKGDDDGKAATKALRKLYGAAYNRMSQRVQQPFTQQWYKGAAAGGAKGVFAFDSTQFKNGNLDSLVIDFVDTDKPPFLISAKGRITKVGQVALELIAEGITEFECGITDDMVAELIEAAGTEGE